MARLEKYHGAKAPWALQAWTGTWLSPAFSDWCIESVVDRLHCPLLALHGQHDEYGSVLHPQRIAQLSNGLGDYVILPDCQHVPYRQAPQAVLGLVGQLLNAVQP